MTPPPWNFSKNSSYLVEGPFPYKKKNYTINIHPEILVATVWISQHPQQLLLTSLKESF